MEYYTALINELGLHISIWMNLTRIILNKKLSCKIYMSDVI